MSVDLAVGDPARASWTRIGLGPKARVQGIGRQDRGIRRTRYPIERLDGPRTPRSWTSPLTSRRTIPVLLGSTSLPPARSGRSSRARRRAQPTDPPQDRREQRPRDGHPLPPGPPSPPPARSGRSSRARRRAQPTDPPQDRREQRPRYGHLRQLERQG